MMNRLTSYPNEILFKILMDLPYDDIKNYCLVDVAARVLCDDDYFWMNKLDHDFTSWSGKVLIPSEFVKRFGLPLWKSGYMKWMNDDLNSDSSSDPDIVIFNMFKTRSIEALEDYNIADICIREGYFEELKDLISIAIQEYKVRARDLKDLVYAAINNNALSILDWLNKKLNFIWKFITPRNINGEIALMLLNKRLGSSANIDTLNWFKDRKWFGAISLDGSRESFNAINVANHAAEYGRIDILEWFEQKGMLPTHDGADAAATNGHIDTLRWLESRRRMPTKNGANNAAKNGHMGTLLWLAERKILPTVVGANDAAANGHIDILQWLEGKGILPTMVGATNAAANGYIDILEWLEERGILPRESATYGAAMTGHVDVLDWLEQRGYVLTQDSAWGAALGGHINVLDWLEKRGILPRPGAADWVVEHNAMELLHWLKLRGILPKN